MHASQARDFHVDPARGAAENDGSADRPWRTLAEVMQRNRVRTRHWSVLPYQPGARLQGVNPDAPVGPGDRLVLYSGDHGDVLIQGAYNDGVIEVVAAPDARPRLERLIVRAGGQWRFEGLHIQPPAGAAPGRGPLVHVQTHGHHGPSESIEISNSTVQSADSIAGWDAQRWISSAHDGIRLEGRDHVVRGNEVLRIHHGIEVHATNTLVDGNQVIDFSGDGLRGLGDGGTFQYNLVRNNFAVDENHDDGFQSWSVGPDGVGSGVVRDITLRGNVIIDHSDPDQPLRGPLQGIGCFDGFFEGWRIENNVVLVEHAHAITLLGVRDTVVINNTVHNPYGGGPGPAWIRMDNHKDGRPSAGVVVRNNLADAWLFGAGVAEDHNLTVNDPAAMYRDPSGDLRLRPGASAIDAGTAQAAPAIDQAGVPRPQGAQIDVGAFEFVQDGPEPEPMPEGEPDPMPEGEPDPMPEGEPDPMPEGEPEPMADAGPQDALPPEPEPVPEGRAPDEGMPDWSLPDAGEVDRSVAPMADNSTSDCATGCRSATTDSSALWWWVVLLGGFLRRRR
jgi:MYXO-CTERM domain-containing protein